MLYDRRGRLYDPEAPLIERPVLTTAYQRARSPWVLNQAYATQPDGPGGYQPLPSTAATLLALLGSPAGWTTANVLAIYACDTASPLVDSLGLGPNLVAAGGPLTGRECVGLPGASFNSKVGVETLQGLSRFQSATGAFGDINGNVFSVLLVARFAPDTTAGGQRLISKDSGNGWMVEESGAALNLYTFTPGAVLRATVAVSLRDSSWHSIAWYIDEPGLASRIFSDIADGAVGTFVAGTTNAGGFSISSNGVNAGGHWQVAYLACFDKAITSAMRATFWRAFQNGLGTPSTYTRANPLVVPITSSRVAIYGANQLAVGYDANFTADGNALKTGLVVDAGETWLGLGTDNQPAWAGTNATNTPVDGPSGMRDSARVADASAVAAGYVTTGSANLAGATNVPFRFAAWRQAVGGGGLNAVYRAYFTGDAGGPEELTWATDAGTVPATFARISGNCTPVGAGHTAVVVRLYPTDGVAASTGTVDFYLEGGVQNRNTDWLGHRRAAAGATSSTSTPSWSMTNVGNARYNPARGSETITISGFQGINGSVLLDWGGAGNPGSLKLDYSGGQLRLRIWDAAGVLAVTVFGGALTGTEHVLDIAWDHALSATLTEGATVLGSFSGIWSVPTTDVTPLAFGADIAGANAARCLIAEV